LLGLLEQVGIVVARSEACFVVALAGGVGVEPGTHFLAEGGFFGRVVEVHEEVSCICFLPFAGSAKGRCRGNPRRRGQGRRGRWLMTPPPPTGHLPLAESAKGRKFKQRSSAPAGSPACPSRPSARRATAPSRARDGNGTACRPPR